MPDRLEYISAVDRDPGPCCAAVLRDPEVRETAKGDGLASRGNASPSRSDRLPVRTSRRSSVREKLVAEVGGATAGLDGLWAETRRARKPDSPNGDYWVFSAMAGRCNSPRSTTRALIYLWK